jgi:hypothetical protein
MMRRYVFFLLLAWFLAWPQLLSADIVLNFEGLPDGTVVTTQFAGMVFSNATVATGGISLNEFEFPPHSGRTWCSMTGVR